MNRRTLLSSIAASITSLLSYRLAFASTPTHLRVSLTRPANDQVDQINQVDRLIADLSNDQFRCPGDSSLEHISHGCMNQFEGSFMRFNVCEQELEGNYDRSGNCTNMVTITLEREYGEFGTVLGSYLEMDAPCSHIHQLDDDSASYHDLMIAWSERRRGLMQARSIFGVPASSTNFWFDVPESERPGFPSRSIA